MLETFDQVLFSIAEKHTGGIPEFLSTIASFLARKTDFFVGANEGEWEKMLLTAFEKEGENAREIYNKKKLEKQNAEDRRKENHQRKVEPKIVDVTEEENKKR